MIIEALANFFDSAIVPLRRLVAAPGPEPRAASGPSWPAPGAPAGVLAAPVTAPAAAWAELRSASCVIVEA